jgi:GNAT superfamily N-acetyltransferase
VLVRKIRPGDEERIAVLSGQLGYPSTPEEIRIRLDPILRDPRHAVYVAEAAGEAVSGWVHVFLYETVESDARAEVSGLVVDETRRRRGVGRILMQQAERWARERGCRMVSLRSNVIREEAHRFYEGLGYQRPKTQHAFRKRI